MVLKSAARIAGESAQLVPGLQLGLMHQQDDSVHSARLPQRSQVMPDKRATVGAFAELKAF